MYEQEIIILKSVIQNMENKTTDINWLLCEIANVKISLEESMKKNMKTIIGKTYIANDNSYIENLTDKNRDHRLAGTCFELPKQAIILSEPYTKLIKCVGLSDKEYLFIDVEYLGDKISVLYNEQCVDKNLQEVIRKRLEIKFNGFYFSDNYIKFTSIY